MGIREAANTDTDESLKMWAVITKLILKIRSRQISWTIFTNTNWNLQHTNYLLPQGQNLRNKTEFSTRPGIYDSIMSWFLPSYKTSAGRQISSLRFGGEGRGKYCTDPIYDVSVQGG